MLRRNFIRACCLSGLGLAVPLGSGRADDYQGRFLIVVLAGGGWDPTMVADPRGEVNRTFNEGDILTAGNIRYAPLPGASVFFNRHYQKMVVVNGINFATGSHQAGVRYCSSGHLGTGHPTLAAVYAASQAPELPLAYLTFGGYENDEGLVPAIRNLNTFVFKDIAKPDVSYGGSGRYHSEWTQGLIRQARDAQLQAYAATAGLPRYRQSEESLLVVRPGIEKLGLLQAELTELADEEHKRQAQIGMAAFKAGIGVALNVSAVSVNGGEFDSHVLHDVKQTTALVDLYEYLDFIWNEAERQGAADRLDVVVTSDFGRTPYYDSESDGNGKGHWPIGSMIVISNRIAQANRVVGATDEGLNAIGVDPESLEPSANGVMLTPEIVHENIRWLLGIADSLASQQFPLRPGSDLRIF